MYKLFRVLALMLLVVPYNSVYYNYIILLYNGWLVGLGIKAKRGFALAKKCTVAPCYKRPKSGGMEGLGMRLDT